MPLILNVHTPSHSFALPYREGDSFATTLTRVLTKAGLSGNDRTLFDESKEQGVGLRYEYEGGRWTLQDDDDLGIMYDRFPPSSTSSITLHLTPPSSLSSTNGGASNSLYVSDAPKVPRPAKSSTGRSIKSSKSATKSSGTVDGRTGGITLGTDAEGDVYESLGDKHKRAWNDFHSENGVRTVVGEIAGVKDVRMLMRLGYRHVYVSRTFALKNGLIPAHSAMGTAGYAGLVNLGQMPIKVGSKTMRHTVMLSEEAHFDVVLGRAWMEKAGIKTDPYDQTSVTYMDTGEKLEIDIVVLRGPNGEIVTVT